MVEGDVGEGVGEDGEAGVGPPGLQVVVQEVGERFRGEGVDEARWWKKRKMGVDVRTEQKRHGTWVGGRERSGLTGLAWRAGDRTPPSRDRLLADAS